MTATPDLAASPLPDVPRLDRGDLAAALRAGWADYRAAPLYGLFFSAVYVLGGLILTQVGAGLFLWTLTLSLGFPLLAPFLAVGLYEASRRLHTGEPLSFSAVLGVVWRERARQIPWAGAVMVLFFLFWSFLAHMLFALFMGPSALLGPPDDLQSYLTGAGIAMMATELVVGGIFAFLLFSLTAISLPMLVDLEIDFVTAMGFSLRTVRANPGVMLAWAATIAVLTLLALVPWFLGLFVVLPVLGHASWHLYRRAAGMA
ncbi:DUF2189 domain-containing protein [Jannaschia rubra]|uniref:Putative integral membrane protein n=1 Tax=Jannaschia rubra TaxID=282197 RepID=A0A0M6XQU8_9RHOB|nr:DUF2189 domain-containing protein [Jannaschia rubra]CTQ33526.1 putative integral membrane protein [Jannaschia rubra]SFG03222.1 Uncharacterized membrane protein [Jannaschia rubra]